MKRLIVMAVFALVFITTSAQAADKGMYFSGNAGLSLASDSDLFYDLGSSGTFESELSFDPGFNIGGAFGYNYGNIRAEFEIAYHSWSMDEETVLPGGIIPGCPCTTKWDGDSSALSFMVNGYYDFHSANSPWVPYLGGGIGFANVDIHFVFDETLGTPTNVPSDDDIVFAYQLMAGIGYNINPSTTLVLGYRYFATMDPEFNPIWLMGGTYEATISAHEFNVGARFMF
jgi:opacity protein-like surface antigen